MAMSGAERQKRWLAKNRAAFNLRRRNARKGKLNLGLQEAKGVVDVPGIEMPLPENPPPFETKKVGEFRMIVLPEEKPITDAPESTDSRSRSDIAMGIWRNDQGGVISKFAYDKLQKLKEHAKANNFEMDDYSQ